MSKKRFIIFGFANTLVTNIILQILLFFIQISYSEIQMKNKEIKIGIIGQGYVGTAIKIGFEERFQVNTYDKYLKNRSTHNSIKSICESSDLIFLCLPTPMNENGSCHLNILDEVLTEINSLISLEACIAFCTIFNIAWVN